jgi:hypothetical protein
MELEERIRQLPDAGEKSLRELARAIDEKDLYTWGHSERVCQYAVALGRALGLDEPKVDLLFQAALLHDLGKVEVPREILTKPGALTDEEFEAVKRHPGRAAELVERIPGMAEVAEVLRHHHERVDGGGYPDGLAGGDIPLESRVLAVVDAYDAMVSNRPYRRPLTVEDALERIRKGMDTHFDPMCAATFVQSLREKRILRASMMGAATFFAEVSIREYERSVRQGWRLSLDGEEASMPSLADLLALDFPELTSEQAEKIVTAVLFPELRNDDLYSEDVEWVKDDEVLVRHPARIDADVRNVVIYDRELFTIVDVRNLEDGRFEYQLKR